MPRPMLAPAYDGRYAARMDPAAAQEPPAEPRPAGTPEVLADAHIRGAEVVTPPGESTSMPPWIPRLLVAVILAMFAAYAAFSLIRRLSNRPRTGSWPVVGNAASLRPACCSGSACWG